MKQIILSAVVVAVTTPALARSHRSPEKRKRIVAIHLGKPDAPSKRAVKPLEKAVRRGASENKKLVAVDRYSDGVGENFDALKVPEPKKIGNSPMSTLKSSRSNVKAEIDINDLQQTVATQEYKPVSEKQSMKQFKRATEKEVADDYF